MPMQSAVILFLLIAAAVGWWYSWPRLWQRVILPRFGS
jgi:hypothetical protein